MSYTQTRQLIDNLISTYGDRIKEIQGKIELLKSLENDLPLAPVEQAECLTLVEPQMEPSANPIKYIASPKIYDGNKVSDKWIIQELNNYMINGETYHVNEITSVLHIAYTTLIRFIRDNPFVIYKAHGYKRVYRRF